MNALHTVQTAGVFVVIVTYNGARWIRSCLQSLQSSTVRVRIVVVDNASQDDTAAICGEFEGLHLIRSPSNEGFGRANNRGIAHALRQGAAELLLLNQDTIVAPDMLAQLLSARRADPALGILCPMQWNDGYEALDPTFLLHYVAPHAPGLLSDALKGQLKPVYTARATPAAAWLLTRECLLRVGGFDPLFFMYCEDDDFSDRARFHGYRSAIVTEARFAHVRGFHHATERQPGGTRFRRLRSRQRSKVVLGCKNLAGSFAKNAWRATVGVALEGVSALLKHADLIHFVASIDASARGLLELPTVRAHRRKCQIGGPAWLQP